MFFCYLDSDGISKTVFITKKDIVTYYHPILKNLRLNLFYCFIWKHTLTLFYTNTIMGVGNGGEERSWPPLDFYTWYRYII